MKKLILVFCLTVAMAGSAADSIFAFGSKKDAGCAFFRQAFGTTVREAVLIPEGVFGFFDPGQEISFRVLTDSTAKDLEFSALVKDESGREVCRIPRRKLEETFRLPGQEAGYYVVDAEIYVEGKKAYFIQSGFAVNCPIGKRDPFFQFSYGALSEMIPGLKRIGCGSIILKAQFARPEYKLCSPEEYAERFLKSYQAFLDDPDFALGIHVGSSYSRKYRSREELAAGWPLLSDAALKHLLDSVGIIHERTRDRVREWSVGCEIPTNATGGDKMMYCGTWTEAMFNQMITARMVGRKLKSSDPGLRLLCGGNNIQSYTDTIERIVMGDLVDDFDEYSIDAYTGNWDLRLSLLPTIIPELKLMDFYKAASDLSVSLGKGKTIRNHERGYAINYGARFDRGLAIEQACLSARSLILSRYAPVSRFDLHRPATKVWSKDSRQDDSRCMTTCWKPIRFGKDFYHIPLPGGAMYATASSELAFAEPLAEVKNGTIYSFLFRKPDGSVLITLWDVANRRKFICDFPDNGEGVNMYGRKIALKDPVIGKAPIYITLKMPPEEAVDLVRKAVLDNTPEFQCAASTDRIYIRSHAAETRVCRLQLPGQPETEVKLLPRKVNVIAADVTGSGILLAPDGRSYAVPMEQTGCITVPRIREKPAFDGSGKWLAGLPSGTLKYPENIRPEEALQPERRYFRTSFNPEGHDISAQYWTAYDDKYFYLAVKVDDPVHQQRQTGMDLRKDDCLQLVLSHESGAGLLAEPGRKPRSEYSFSAALTADGTQLVKLLGKDKGIKDHPANVTRSGNTTFYEVAIPWKAIGGRARRFGFVVFNNDWPAVTSAPYYLALTDGIADEADDTKLKILKFAE